MKLKLAIKFQGPVILGTVSAVLGFLVIFGWHTRVESLVQIYPDFVPMQYNTALGFLLCGSSLVLFHAKKTVPGSVFSFLVWFWEF